MTQNNSTSLVGYLLLSLVVTALSAWLLPHVDAAQAVAMFVLVLCSLVFGDRYPVTKGPMALRLRNGAGFVALYLATYVCATLIAATLLRQV